MTGNYSAVTNISNRSLLDWFDSKYIMRFALESPPGVTSCSTRNIATGNEMYVSVTVNCATNSACFACSGACGTIQSGLVLEIE